MNAPSTELNDAAQIPPDATVLENRLLADGYEHSQTSRFGDDRWDLNPAQHKRHTRSQCLDFRTIPECVRDATKELFYAMLNDQVDGEEEPHIETVRGHFTSAKMFLTWIHDNGHHNLAGLTQADLTLYAAFVQQKGLKPSTQAHRLRSAGMFWTYRTKLSTDRLEIDPCRLKKWTHNGPNGSSRGENTTERVPEQVMAPLLVWALRWVDDFADDLIAAYQEWRNLNANTRMNRIRNGSGRADGVVDRARVLMDLYRTEGRALPGTAGQPNYSHLARELHCAPGALNQPHNPARKIIETAIPDVGVADATYLRAPIRGQLDGAPWRGPIKYHEMERLMRLTHGAAYIVVAYLSGMRDSEVKHLQIGCLSRSVRTDGVAYRRKITSLAFKGEADIRGVSATWVVTESVERAVSVLERLRDDDRPFLFALPATSRFYHKNSRNEATTNSSTNRNIALFIQWINEYCDETGRTDRIPLVASREVRVTSSQFRRTLAWFIAREPGGVIAGAIAYRHASVHMFEGYAGTSDSGFRAEVDAEMAVMRAEACGHLVTTSAHRQLSGPAAKEAESRLEEFARHIVFEGKVLTDRKRLQREIQKNDHRVYFGKFVTCVHDPDRALCARNETDETPSLPDCIPLSCRNVALTEANRQEITANLREIEALIDNPDRWAPYVLHRLQTRRAEIAEFLGRTAQSTPGVNP